jgi:hypothetical protein
VEALAKEEASAKVEGFSRKTRSGGVAPRSKTTAGMLAPRALPDRLFHENKTPLNLSLPASSGSLSLFLRKKLIHRRRGAAPSPPVFT